MSKEVIELPSKEKSDEIHALYQGPRGTAVKILSRFECSDTYIDKLLEYELRINEFSVPDKALLIELVNGVARWQARLDWVLNGFYHGEFVKCTPTIRNALRTALYQMLMLDKIPPSIAIQSTVEMARRLRGEQHSSNVNGMLRNILRHLTDIRYPKPEDDIVLYLSVMYSHKQWMVKRWLERFGREETEQLLKANNQRPLLCLRVNTMKSTVQEVSVGLSELHVMNAVSPYLAEGINVSSLRDVNSTDLYKNGFFAIQDVAGCLSVKLAQPKPGMRVIDLCSAPGSKSLYCAELMNNVGEILAFDKYESRAQAVDIHGERLGISIIKSAVADSMELKEAPADIVFVDAPSSALGLLSQRPEIKLMRDFEDIFTCMHIQRKILTNAVTMVKLGGIIIYSTQTIEPEENELNVAWFLEQFPNFVLEPAQNFIPAEVCRDGFLYTMPHTHKAEGAFVARLKRVK